MKNLFYNFFIPRRRNPQSETDNSISYYALFNRIYSQMTLLIPDDKIKNLLLNISLILYPKNFLIKNSYTNTKINKNINEILIDLHLMKYIDVLDKILIEDNNKRENGDQEYDNDIKNFDDYQENEDLSSWYEYLSSSTK